MESKNSRTGATRTFTIKEANEVLPLVKERFGSIFDLNTKIKSLTSDIENLVSIWGKDVLEKDHTDNPYYFVLISKRESIFQELIRKINDIQALGCIVKDVDSGLVDFYHNNNGELVFLCWKYGEEKIKHWHVIDGGFNSRVDVKLLK